MKKYMVMTFLVFNSIMAFGVEESQSSCIAETSLIERYVKNYRSAINDYNQLKRGAFDGEYIDEKDEQGRNVYRKMTLSEKNALFDALEAQHAASLPWGFKWLAAYWVENRIDSYTKVGMNDCVDAIKPVVEERLAAMIGKQWDARYMPEITTCIDTYASQAIVINTHLDLNNEKHGAARYGRDYYEALNPQEIKDRCKEAYQNLTEDKIASIVSGAKSDNKLQVNRSDPYSYQHSMRLHKQKYKNYKRDKIYMDNRYHFCKYLLPMIKERDKQIVKLKAENSVDANIVLKASENHIEKLKAENVRKKDIPSLDEDKPLTIAGLLDPLAQKIEQDKGWFGW